MLTENLAPFFNSSEFAKAITIGGIAKSAIFDNQALDAFGVNGTSPRITLPDSAAAGVVRGTAVVVDTVSYTVRDINSDGVGVTEILLDRV